MLRLSVCVFAASTLVLSVMRGLIYKFISYFFYFYSLAMEAGFNGELKNGVCRKFKRTNIKIYTVNLNILNLEFSPF